MQDLDLIRDQFAGVSIPSYFYPAFNSHFTEAILNIVQPSLSWVSNRRFSLGIFLKTFLTVFSSVILSTYPNPRNISFPIYEIMTGSLHRSINSWKVRILHTLLFDITRIFVYSTTYSTSVSIEAPTSRY